MKKILLLTGFILSLTMNAQEKKNVPIKLYKNYYCINEVDIEDFIKTNEYLSCQKSESYSITISKNSITITELNKINRVKNKNTYSDLVCEHRDDFDVYKKDDGSQDGNQGFQEFFVSKDRKKIIEYWISYNYTQTQNVYILK